SSQKEAGGGHRAGSAEPRSPEGPGSRGSISQGSRTAPCSVWGESRATADRRTTAAGGGVEPPATRWTTVRSGSHPGPTRPDRRAKGKARKVDEGRWREARGGKKEAR